MTKILFALTLEDELFFKVCLCTVYKRLNYVLNASTLLRRKKRKKKKVKNVIFSPNTNSE